MQAATAIADTAAIAPRHERLAAYATRLLPVAIFGAARMLDMSMRRPSLTWMLMHSFRLVN